MSGLFVCPHGLSASLHREVHNLDQLAEAMYQGHLWSTVALYKLPGGPEAQIYNAYQDVFGRFRTSTDLFDSRFVGNLVLVFSLVHQLGSGFASQGLCVYGEGFDTGPLQVGAESFCFWRVSWFW